MTQLPTIKVEGREWIVDEKLKQVRAADNPHDFVDLRELDFMAWSVIRGVGQDELADNFLRERIRMEKRRETS